MIVLIEICRIFLHFVETIFKACFVSIGSVVLLALIYEVIHYEK